MRDGELQEAIFHLKSGKPDSIHKLETILEFDGFQEKIVPADLNYADWYCRNCSKRKEDQTNYLVPYQEGFIRRNNNTQAVAAYGVIRKFWSHNILSTDKPVHFFYISKTEVQEDSQELVDWFSKKAKETPGNLVDIKIFQDSLGDPHSRFYANSIGAMLLAETFAINTDAAKPYIDALDPTGSATVLFFGAAILLNLAVITHPIGRNIMRALGSEKYNAPANVKHLQARVRNYGIKELHV